MIELGDDSDPIEAGVAIHYERYETAGYAFALASLARPDFPLPIGVFRAVERPSYDQMLHEQVDHAIDDRGEGTLRGLLHSGDTWIVEPS